MVKIKHTDKDDMVLHNIVINLVHRWNHQLRIHG